MRRVLAAGCAEFAQLNTVWVITTVLAGDVVASFAIATCHGDFRTDIGLFSHSNLLALLGHIPRLRNVLETLSSLCVAEAGLEPATQRL